MKEDKLKKRIQKERDLLEVDGPSEGLWNNIEQELVETQEQYQFNIAEDVKGDEYYNRLYFRRRQGWGKVLIST